jgi:sugar lactone lactonase YvrE
MLLFSSLLFSACGPRGAKVETLAGGTRGFADGQGITAQFDNPADVAAGPDGSIYVADSANHRIRKISAAGLVSTLAGSSKPGHQDGVGGAALLSSPTGISVNASGVIVFADSVATDPHPMFVRLVSAEGKVTALAGSSSAGSQDGQGTQAFFRTPANVAIDKDGNVYVADTSNHRIRKVTPDGNVTTFAGSPGSDVVSGYNDGPAAEAQFKSPAGIAVDGSGNVYVADTGNHCIRLIANGQVTTLAGSPTPGKGNGKGKAASFNFPNDVAVDSVGNVFVADSANHLIRKITPDGAVTTIAGAGQPGYTDGPAAQAQFRLPQGITVDSKGIIYVADTGNNCIRKITP